MTDLDKLIEAVEAGENPGIHVWRAAFPDLPDDDDYHRADMAANACRGWLDAARHLHDALLPGWWWSIGTCAVSDDARVAPEGPESVMPDGTEWADFTDIDLRPPGNPARAWLLAILRAVKAKAHL